MNTWMAGISRIVTDQPRMKCNFQGKSAHRTQLPSRPATPETPLTWDPYHFVSFLLPISGSLLRDTAPQCSHDPWPRVGLVYAVESTIRHYQQTTENYVRCISNSLTPVLGKPLVAAAPPFVVHLSFALPAAAPTQRPCRVLSTLVVNLQQGTCSPQPRSGSKT